MKRLVKVLFVILIVYIVYAFVASLVVYMFDNPNAEENLEILPEEFQGKKSRDRVQLIESPEDGARIRLRLIESAEESIDIAYYTFRNGNISKSMIGAILEAADQGVEVRILLDSLSVLPSLSGEFKDILYGLDSHRNISFKFYHPVNPLFPFNWNKRLHDKMIIVDEKLALIGGRNIADNYYLKDTKWLSFSKDRDVLIFNPESLEENHSVIKDMKSYYEKTWAYEYSRSFVRKLSSRGKVKSNLICEKLKKDYIEKGKVIGEINWEEYTMDVRKIEFIHNPVGKINQDPWCLRKLLLLSSQAEKSIFMQSPYIIPSRRMEGAFNKYHIDLEKATILTNSNYSSPNHLSIAAYSNHREKMVDEGIKIYEYQGENSIHGKTYIFDDYISVIGSFNLDPRSTYINSESMVVIYGEEFASKLKEKVEVDLEQSLKVAGDYSYVPDKELDQPQVSKIKKTIISILSKIAPALEHIL